MSNHDLRKALVDRTRQSRVRLAPTQLDALTDYLTLLTKWNAKINLTSLPLRPPSDETWSRLIIEPLLAAEHIVDDGRAWIDVGSGGGSPGIPIKIARPAVALVMVEARERKAAFLREAVRSLFLEPARVEADTFERVADRYPASFSVATARAVRIDRAFQEAARRALTPDGTLLLFSNQGDAPELMGFSRPSVVPIGASAVLLSYGIVPRGT